MERFIRFVKDHRVTMPRTVLLAVVATAFILFLIASELTTVSYPEARLEITQSFRTSSSSQLPPSELSYGKEIKLDASTETLPRSSSQPYTWYTSVIELVVAPNRVWSVFLPPFSHDGALYVNGHEIAELQLSRTVAKNNYPALLNIPNGLLKAGNNEIQIGVAYHSKASVYRLEPFLLGPLSEMIHFYNQVVLFSETFPKLIIALLILLAAAFGFVWLTSPSDMAYAAFSSMCFLWALHTYAFNLTNWHYIDWRYSLHLNNYFLIIFTAVLVAYCHYEIRKIFNSKLWVAFFIGVSVFFVIVLLLKLSIAQCQILFSIILLIQIAYGIGLIVQSLIKLHSISYLMMFILTVLLFHTIKSLLFDYSDSAIITYSSIQFFAPVFLAAIGLKLVRDFIVSRNRLVAVNSNLESIIEKRSLELELAWKSRESAEYEKLLSQERTRIMMEMHDGLGSRLVSVLAEIDAPEMNKSGMKVDIGNALDELRMVVDSISPVDSDVSAVLAMFRHRLDKSLKGTQLSLKWLIGDMPPIEELGSQKILNILRILQEATANAIKYSDGDEIRVSTGVVNSGKVFINIHDNGHGPKSSNWVLGQGIRNMQRRAKLINGEMALSTSSDGVDVTLYLNTTTENKTI